MHECAPPAPPSSLVTASWAPPSPAGTNTPTSGHDRCVSAAVKPPPGQWPSGVEEAVLLKNFSDVINGVQAHSCCTELFLLMPVRHDVCACYSIILAQCLPSTVRTSTGCTGCGPSCTGLSGLGAHRSWKTGSDSTRKSSTTGTCWSPSLHVGGRPTSDEDIGPGVITKPPDH